MQFCLNREACCGIHVYLRASPSMYPHIASSFPCRRNSSGKDCDTSVGFGVQPWISAIRSTTEGVGCGPLKATAYVVALNARMLATFMVDV